MRSLLSNKALWGLTLGHFTIDTYSGAMPVLMLFITSALQLSPVQVGTVFMLYSLCSSLSQPIFGYLSDRWGGRWFVVGGLLWMTIFQAMSGFVPNYAILLMVLPLAGFGAAAFHPHAASSANIISGKQKTAGVAIFMLGGNGGFAVGPIFAATILGGFALLGWAFSGFGLQGTAVMAIFGLLLAPVLYWVTPARTRKTSASPQTASKQRIELNPAFTRVAIVALLIVMSLRAWSQSAISAYVPLFFKEVAGYTVAEASQLAFVILICLAAGSLTGGFLADRVGGRLVMFVAFLCSTPLIFLMFWLKGASAFYLAPFLGFMTGAGWPPMLVMAQELFPKNAGVASGLSLGFVFAMGGFGTWVTGLLAEPMWLGLTNSLLLLSLLPVIAALFTLALPTREAMFGATTPAPATESTSTGAPQPEPASD